jgi:hypothetical protein
MIKKYLLIGVAILLVGFVVYKFAGSKKSKDGNLFGNDSTNINEGLPVSKEAMGTLVENIASPVEMSALIKSIGAPFSQKYLAPSNTDNFNTNLSKAFNLGILAADLGYINMYSRTSLVIQYITAIKELADGISVGQFFDFSTLKRLATNNENIDSLMYISIHSFNVMDDYLRKHNRSNLSALMISGVYVEGLYLTTQVAKEKPNKKLTESIGEQKTIFNELMLILKNYKKDPYFSNVIADLETIMKEFDPVKITIEVGNPEPVEKNGTLTIIQHSKSIVTIDDAILKRIINQTEIIRNKLIK